MSVGSEYGLVPVPLYPRHASQVVYAYDQVSAVAPPVPPARTPRARGRSNRTREHRYIAHVRTTHERTRNNFSTIVDTDIGNDSIPPCHVDRCTHVSRDLTRRLEAGAEFARLQAQRAVLKKEAREVLIWPSKRHEALPTPFAFCCERVRTCHGNGPCESRHGRRRRQRVDNDPYSEFCFVL